MKKHTLPSVYNNHKPDLLRWLSRYPRFPLSRYELNLLDRGGDSRRIWRSSGVSGFAVSEYEFITNTTPNQINEISIDINEAGFGLAYAFTPS